MRRRESNPCRPQTLTFRWCATSRRNCLEIRCNVVNSLYSGVLLRAPQFWRRMETLIAFSRSDPQERECREE